MATARRPLKAGQEAIGAETPLPNPPRRGGNRRGLFVWRCSAPVAFFKGGARGREKGAGTETRLNAPSLTTPGGEGMSRFYVARKKMPRPGRARRSAHPSQRAPYGPSKSRMSSRRIGNAGSAAAQKASDMPTVAGPTSLRRERRFKTVSRNALHERTGRERMH